MSTLKTHNLQSPDAGSVNIVMAPNAGMVVAGLSTYSNQINVGSNIKLGTAGVVTATTFSGNLSGGTVSGSTGTFTGDLSIAQNLVHTGDTDTKLEFHTDSIKLFTAGTQKFRIYDDGVVSIGQSSKSSTVGAGGIDIQGNGTNCILEMGNPFPGFSGGVVPEFRITATLSGHEVKFESIWGGDNALHPHMAFTGGRTHFYKATNSDEIARFDSDKFFIGQTTGSSRLCVSDTNPVIAELHHSDGGTNDEARIMLGALSSNPPNQRGAGIAAVNNGAGHDLTVKCSTNHSSGPSEKVRFKSNGDVSISDGNLIVANGHGIDFSATADGGTGTPSELLDDYEEGYFAPTIENLTSGYASGTFYNRQCRYTKVGNMVTVWGHIQFWGNGATSGSDNTEFSILGFPFEVDGVGYRGTCGGSVVAQSWRYQGSGWNNYNVDSSNVQVGINNSEQIRFFVFEHNSITGTVTQKSINGYNPNIEWCFTVRVTSYK